MLAVKIVENAQVIRTLSAAEFIGAAVCLSAMYIETAIEQFNKRAKAENLSARAELVSK
jgi:hypothetical protein